MKTYIAILRGINLSGKNKIQMADLKEKLSTLNFRNIRTYIQSGNVIFKYQEASQSDLAKMVEDAILKNYRYKVPTTVLTEDELMEIVSNNPFKNAKYVDENRLYVTYLFDSPLKENIEKLIETSYLPDKIAFKNKTIYLYCPNGYARTKYTNTFIENKLKLIATTRNWKTSNKLVEIATK